MSKTLDETKEYIMEFSKQHHLADSSTRLILHDIETDENGLVTEHEWQKIHNTMIFLSDSRKATINKLTHVRKERKEDA